MTKEEFERVFAAAAEKSGVAGMARDYQFAENLQRMMIDLRDKLCASEQPSEELEEAFDEVLPNPNWYISNDGEDAYNVKQMKEMFNAGANWQKEQIMKSAIDGCQIKRNGYTQVKVLNGFSTTCETIQKFKDGDKVKILIIKEDKQ